ncbi:uncharacterized protein GGS22DRAFT_66138 [Annulohypoxylon maeteangense]|uniref:uncharacterized protein n=1 Tax=Annulohypoxylon maeteangense TaxID=1927788 RepID=UPI002007C0DA|nr:uncharacterized protein GGS22DRAFT_66138 [Annulohypoxylon maeteangense]KAI0889015.1 hypothetical protein GGS22DRAFT_66138 [Annulohypoxylon maeteangense]
MLRHSASQVFGGKHPALSPRGDDDIEPRPNWLLISKNSRPVVERLHQLPNPDLSSPHFEESAPMLAPIIQPLPHVRHMPSTSAPFSSASTMITPIATRDASSLHPVFFTARLRKSPFVLNAAGLVNPVAHGYAYEESRRRVGGAIPAML